MPIDARRGPAVPALPALALVLTLAFAPGCSHHAPATGGAAGKPEPVTLAGTSWVLTDLGGGAVLQGVQATLVFGDSGGVSGSGSCNRFTGTYRQDGAKLTIGPLASTRMACEMPVSEQEASYLKILQAADRAERQGDELLVSSKITVQPMRFAPLRAE